MPRAYWDVRQEDPAKAQELIGGKGFSVKKVDGQGWMIARGGEKVEHDNPADHYNTVLKMAKKRALVDAVLTSTAASDIFTQDLEEISASIATLTPATTTPTLTQAIVIDVPAEPAPSRAHSDPGHVHADSGPGLHPGSAADHRQHRPQPGLSAHARSLRQEPRLDLGRPHPATTPLVRGGMDG